MVKRSIEQEIRNKNFGIRNGNFKKNAVVKNQGTKHRVQRILGDCWQWETNGQCVKWDNCSFSHDINKRGKVCPSNPSPNSFMQQNERKWSITRSPRGRSPNGRMSRWPCKDYLRGTCNNSFCEKWHPPECLFCKTKSGCRFGEKCSHAHRQVDEQPTKRSKSNNDKSAVAMLKKNDLHESVWRLVVNRDKSHERSERPDIKRDTCHELKQGPVRRRSSNAQQLGGVFQDMTPPKSILRKRSDMQKHIQRVKFTKAIARHTKIRDQNPSLGNTCPGEPHQRSANAPKFEDRSQEETKWQEQGAVEAGQKVKSSFGVPSRREGPPSIWDTHGTSGNVFADPLASSSAPYPQELHQWNSSIEEPLHTSTVEKSERPEQNQDLRCHWTVSQKFSHLQWRRLFNELWSRPTTTADFWSSLWQVPYTSNICLLEDKVQDRGVYLFTISYGSDAMDQRSGVGWFSGWIKIFVIYSWYFNAEFWSTWCEDCFSTE